MSDNPSQQDWLNVQEGHVLYRDLFDAESAAGKLVIAGLVSWTIYLQLYLDQVGPDATPEEFQAAARENLRSQINFDLLFEQGVNFLRAIGWEHIDRLAPAPAAGEQADG